MKSFIKNTVLYFLDLHDKYYIIKSENIFVQVF